MKKIIKTYLISIILLFFAVLPFLLVSFDINNVTGVFSLIDIAPEGYTFQEPADTSPEAAQQALAQAQEEIKAMEEFNFSVTFVKDALFEANQSYDNKDYLQVFRLTQLISFIKKEKIKFLDKVELIRNKEQKLQKDKTDTSEGKALIEEAMAAFEADQLEDARSLLKEAGVELEKAAIEKSRIKGLARLSKNFLIRRWWQIILVAIVLGVVSYPAVKKVIKKKRQQKLARLKVELEKTKELIKQLQKTCFVDKKITPKTYKAKAAKYEERIAEIKHTIPVIEAQLKKKKAEPKKKTKGVLEVKR